MLRARLGFLDALVSLEFKLLLRVHSLLDFANVRQDVIESRRFSKKHFLHLTVVAANRLLLFIARNDLQRARHCQVVSRCCLSEEGALVPNHRFQQSRIGQRLAADVVPVHSRDIIVVAR